MSITTRESVAPELTVDDQIAVDYEAAQRLGEGISEAWELWIDRKKRITAQRHLRASSLGMKCERRLYLDVAAWSEKAPIPTQVQQYFERGKAHEPLILDLLSSLGYRIVGEQRDLYDEDLRISARVEGHWVEKESGRPILAEVKSTADLGLARCETVDQLRKSPRGRQYYSQVQVYLHHFELYAALLLVWDIGAWRPVPVPIPFDVEEADRLVARAKRINAHLDAGEPPDFIDDPRECRRCHHYGRSCHPPLTMGEGVLVLNNEVLLAKIERAQAIEPIGREWSNLVKAIRDQVREMGERVLLGEFLISNDGYDRTEYQVPPAVKAKYKTTERATRTVWKRLPERRKP